MKKSVKIYALVLLLSSSTIASGQKHTLDSIHVRIDNNLELSLTIYEYADLAENVEKDLKSLQSILKDNFDVPEKESYTIDYVADKLVSIKQTEPGKKIIWENGSQSSYQYSKQCNINSNKYFLNIQYNEPESLISDTLIIRLKEVIDTISHIQGRLSKSYNFSFVGETLIHDKQFDKVNGRMDVINLKGGVGLNLIKNQPVIDLSAEIGILFSKKGILKNQYYLSYNQLSDFDENSKVNLNGFVNIGYRYNLSNDLNDPNWLGLEVGFLTAENGELFEKNTYKFGFNWEIGKYISVSPQFYLSGDFKVFYPAIRIGFGF
ncbi:MAG: hypothetical protein IPH20_12635 [Bacteroidales bacterium]|nr:hypothetical protein [Bacteroidales bacterium]